MEVTWRRRDVVIGGGAKAKKKTARRSARGAESEGAAAGGGRREEEEEAMRRKGIGEGGHGGEMVGGNGGADSYLERGSHLSLRPYKPDTQELKAIRPTGKPKRAFSSASYVFFRWRV